MRCVESPTSSISTVLKHFCEVVNKFEGGSSSPEKKDLNWTIPAFVSNKVGSPTGIREELGYLKWFLDSK